MKNTKPLVWVLWLGVLIVGGWIGYDRIFGSGNKGNAKVEENDGRVFVDLDWKQLPDVDRFQLTERSGEKFDSAELAGKPYAVNLFFTSCPTICRRFNDRVKSLTEKYKDELDMTFISITCDPESDTPEVLRKYADSYDADPKQWLFLTGAEFEIKQLAEFSFRVIADPANHTDDILLVDRWGRYRDRFKWNDDREMERFDKVLKEVLAETEPPLDKTVKTRNVLASKAAFNPDHVKYLKDFRLKTSEGKDLFSRDLTGGVWIASFFFSRCPGICVRQNATISTLQERFKKEELPVFSITTDAEYDTESLLRGYARKLKADPEIWTFLTGDPKYIERVAGEYFGAHSHDGHHPTELLLVDRWGEVRGKYHWGDEKEVEKLISHARQLKLESTPHDYLKSENKAKDK